MNPTTRLPWTNNAIISLALISMLLAFTQVGLCIPSPDEAIANISAETSKEFTPEHLPIGGFDRREPPLKHAAHLALKAAKFAVRSLPNTSEVSLKRREWDLDFD